MEPQDPKTTNAAENAADPQKREPAAESPQVFPNSFPQGFPRRRMRRRHRGIVFALVVIIVGALLLAAKMGAATINPILLSWQMVVMVLALLAIISNLAFRRRVNFGALLVMGAAFFLLIPRIGAAGMTLFGWTIPAGFASTWWPVLLIFAGVLWLVRWIACPRSFRRRGWDARWNADARFAGGWQGRGCGHGHRHMHGHGGRGCRDGRGRRSGSWEDRERRFGSYTADGNGNFDSVFGSGKHIVLDPEFKGGKINAVFGEVTLDLRKTALPENKNTLLEINIVFGNAVVIVPESWNVVLHMPATVGGTFVDKREPTAVPADMTRTLEIEVHSVFSGGELRN